MSKKTNMSHEQTVIITIEGFKPARDVIIKSLRAGIIGDCIRSDTKKKTYILAHVHEHLIKNDR